MSEDQTGWLFLIIFLSTAVTTISFMRISMSGIERRMREAGEPRPWHWDTNGLRGTFYVFFIVIPFRKRKGQLDPLGEIRAIEPFVTKLDRVLAYLMFISFTGFVSIAFYVHYMGFSVD